MPSRPRLLYLVTEDWYFCSHRLPLAVAAQKAGYDVVVVTRVHHHGAAITQAGLTLIPLTTLHRTGLNPLGELRTLWELFTIYRQQNPDIVHHVALKPVLYGSFIARLLGVKGCVNTLAGLGFVFLSTNFLARCLRPFVKVLLRGILRGKTTHLIVQNRQDEATMVHSLGLPSPRVHLIRGSGVDTQVYHPQGEREKEVVLVAARMLWDKGIDYFVAAAALLKKAGIPAKFVLVGGTDPHNPTAIPPSQLEAWQGAGLVTWWGHREDMPSILSTTTIFCLPTLYEGLPKAILEAMACGCPIVATSIPGCAEVVTHGVQGLLVPPRDAVALAQALAQLLADPEKRARMGEAGRRRVEKELALPQVMAQTLEVYGQIWSPSM